MTMSEKENRRSLLAAAIASPLLAGAVLELMGATWIARPAVGTALALAAALVVGLGGASAPVRSHRWQLVESGALLLAALLVSDAWRYLLLGAAVTGLAGGGLKSHGRLWERGAGLILGLRAVVLSALPVVLVVYLLVQMGLSFQIVPGIAGPLAEVLRLLHVNASAFGESVAIMNLHGTPSIPMTWSNVGVFAISAMAIAYMSIRMTCGGRIHWRETVWLLIILIVAWATRMVLAITAALHYEVFVDFDIKEFPAGWLAIPLLQILWIGLVASPLLAAKSRTLARYVSVPRRAPSGWLAPAFAGLAFVTGFLLVFAEPGERKPGRIMIDEAHSRWEPIEPSYDTDWYGADSGYNYAVIADYLRHHYDVTVCRDAIDRDTLKEVDVLIIKVPTRAYSSQEREVILDFVREGGGLFLIGEHTNVFGSGHYINQLSLQLGFQFRYDVVFDLRDKFQQVYSPPKLAKHPILAYVDEFPFAVSCSIQPRSIAVRPVINGGGLWSLDIDYAVSNFYPTPNLDLNAIIVPHTQCVARHFGKGRVAGFTDSTVWSTFSAMLPGKPELLLGTVEWLNRENRFYDTYPPSRPMLLLLGVVLFVTMLKWTRAAGRIMALSTASLLLGVYAADAAGRSAYTAPEPKPGFQQVCFVLDHEAYDIHSWGWAPDLQRSYSIFYQWVQRVGLYPKILKEADPLPKTGKLVVRILGAGASDPLTAENTQELLESGTPVLLLVLSDADSSHADLQANYGMAFEPARARETRTLQVAGTSAAWPVPWRINHLVEGGKPLLTGEGGEAVLLVSESHPLYVLIGGEQFADIWMGKDQANIPDTNLRRLFELEFALLRGLVGGSLVDELRDGATRPLEIRRGSRTEDELPVVDRPASKGTD